MASEAGFNAAPNPKHNVNAKFRPMLSTKQVNTRLNDSGEQLDQSSSESHSLAVTTANEDGVDEKATLTRTPITQGNNDNETSMDQPQQQQQQDQQPVTDQSALASESKTNISKDDLIRLLSMLKSELQSKEMALAAIKCEQLKRLINPVEISRSSLAKTYMQLQDRLRTIDKNNNPKVGGGNKVIRKSSTEQTLSASTAGTVTTNGHNISNISQNQQAQHLADLNDLESLNMLNTLLELLDRHPLLALPRDSIYCLDFNCNELSTKNYLNLKIQHLDNLINQHRRFRFHMNERLKRSEQRYLDLTRELELERNAKLEDDKANGRLGSKSVLLKHIVQLKESLEKERASKQAIVMTLLNDLLDERERNESLKNQTTLLSEENNDLKNKLANLELESAKLKTKLDLSDAKASASSKPAPLGASLQQTSATNTSSTSSQNARQGPVKPTTSVKANSSPVSTNSNSRRAVDSSSGTSTNTTSASSTTNQRSTMTNAPRLVSSSSTDQTTSRVQSLSKSASVVSPGQQVRAVGKSSSGNLSSPASQNARASGAHPLKKPQVPAKPAQLLDQQRSSFN